MTMPTGGTRDEGVMDRRKNYITQGFDIPGGRIEVVLTTDKPAETRHYQLMKETVQAIDRWSSLQPDEGRIDDPAH